MAKRRGNLEGSFRQRGDGSWEGRVEIAGKRRSFYGRTKADAQRALRKAVQAAEDGLPVAPKRQTLAQFIDRWLADVVKPNRRRSTYTSYKRYCDLHIKPALGRVPLTELSPQQVQSFLNAQSKAGKAPRTVAYERAILRRALGQATRWGLVVRNAAALVDPPRQVKRETRYLTTNEAQRLADALAGDRLETLVIVALTTGLRRGEMCGLHWRDVDLDRGRLTVAGQYARVDGEWVWVEPKTDTSARTLVLPPFVVEVLRRHRTRQLEERLVAGPAWEDWNLVFPGMNGRPQHGDSLLHRFQKRLDRLGLPRVTLHGLRHTAATMLLARGMTLGELQKYLGHSQIALTADLYAHAAPEIFQSAAERMEAIFAAR